MRIAIVLAVLLFAACAQTTTCVPPEIPRELGGCCADLNGNGVCDTIDGFVPEPEEPPEEIVVPDVPDVEPEPEPEPVEEPVEDPRSLTEQYRDTFWNLTALLSYYLETDEYGELWVWLEPERTQYITVERMFFVNRRVVEGSDYDPHAYTPWMIARIEERRLPVMNYLVRNHGTGKWDGCFVDSVYYKIENCIGDYPNDNPVIQYDVKFTAPLTPLDWLTRYDGKKPSSVNEDRTLITEDGKRLLVDEVTFDYPTTTFYIHKKYKIPVQVQVFDHLGRPTERAVFRDVKLNTQVTGDAPLLEAAYSERSIRGQE